METHSYKYGDALYFVIDQLQFWSSLEPYKVKQESLFLLQEQALPEMVNNQQQKLNNLSQDLNQLEIYVLAKQIVASTKEK